MIIFQMFQVTVEVGPSVDVTCFVYVSKFCVLAIKTLARIVELALPFFGTKAKHLLAKNTTTLS